MQSSGYVVEFRLDEKRLGIQIAFVDRIIHAVAVTDVPGSPVELIGVIDLQGTVLPVVDLRRLLGLEERLLSPDDLFIIIEKGDERAAIVADGVTGLLSLPDPGATGEGVPSPEQAYVLRIVREEEGIVFVCDAERMLELARSALLEGTCA